MRQSTMPSTREKSNKRGHGLPFILAVRDASAGRREVHYNRRQRDLIVRCAVSFFSVSLSRCARLLLAPYSPIDVRPVRRVNRKKENIDEPPLGCQLPVVILFFFPVSLPRRVYK